MVEQDFSSAQGGRRMARSKQQHQVGKVEGAFGKEKQPDEDGPLTVSGGTPGSTPAPGKSKSADPEEVDENDAPT
jgi:hypothetical protein